MTEDIEVIADVPEARRPIRVVSLDCWQDNGLVYQADGRTDDGRHVSLHFRGGRLSVGVGPDAEAAGTADTFLARSPSPARLDRAALARWTAGRFEWPAAIAGFGPDAGRPRPPD